MLQKSTLLLLLLTLSTSTFAQGYGLPQACVIVYEHAGFQGRSLNLHNDWTVVRWDESWNDRISSIRIPRGFEVEVYRHCEFNGPSVVLRNDWSVSGRYDNWNDQISSIRIRRIRRPQNCEMQSAGIRVFEHSGFQGRSMRIGDYWQASSWNDFWNDRISSIRIPPGYEVRIFQHGNGGASRILRTDWTVYNQDFWNDEISRIEVQKTY